MMNIYVYMISTYICITNKLDANIRCMQETCQLLLQKTIQVTDKINTDQEKNIISH